MNIKIGFVMGVIIGFVMGVIILVIYLSPIKADDVRGGEKLSDDAKIISDEDILVEVDGCEDEGEAVPPLFHNQVDAKLVGKLAKGMRRIIKRRDRATWYYCGESLGDKKQEEISIAIAYHTLVNQQSLGMDAISPWGIIATAYNESGFDACALGLNPRKWAYSKGLLERRRDPDTNVKMRSHSREEVLEFIKSPAAKKRYSKSGFDLGYCQVLSRFYRGQEEDALTTDKGMRMCILEMQVRARRNKTTIPWLYWKGMLGTEWYRDKIKRWAKAMGASKYELKKI